MNLRDFESDLAAALVARLEHKVALVVNPASADQVDDYVEARYKAVHVFEADPRRRARLKRRFRREDRVRVHQLARRGVSGSNEPLYLTQRDGGVPASEDTDEAQRADARPALATADGRSSRAAVEDAGVEPPVGILRVVGAQSVRYALAEAAELECEVVMAEVEGPAARSALPATSLPRLAEALRSLGFSNLIVVREVEDVLHAAINDTESGTADSGHVLFVRDDRWTDLAPPLFRAVARLQRATVGRALEYRSQVQRQQELLEEKEALLIDTIQQLRAAHTLHRVVSLLPRRVRKFGRKAVISSDPSGPSRRVPFSPRLDLLQHEPEKLTVPAPYQVTALPPDPPSISIVTPSLNQDRFIEKTMTSVLDQEYPELQYVVQDGGSTDATPRLLERYAAKLHYWESAPDGGQAAAINSGFRHVTGEIMAYLNSDDFLLPGSLAYVAQFFRMHPEVGVIYSHRVIVDANDREIGRWILPRHDDETLMWADYVPQETLFWRRSVWNAAGGSIDEDLKFALDWDMLLRFRRAGARFVRVPRFLAAFRVHEDSKTFTRIAELGMREMDRLRERWHGRPISTEEVRRSLRGFYARHLVYRGLYAARLLRY